MVICFPLTGVPREAKDVITHTGGPVWPLPSLPTRGGGAWPSDPLTHMREEGACGRCLPYPHAGTRVVNNPLPAPRGEGLCGQ